MRRRCHQTSSLLLQAMPWYPTFTLPALLPGLLPSPPVVIFLFYIFYLCL